MVNKVRYACFDLMRAGAIVLIMFCHWFRSNGNAYICDLCGIVGNSLFFVLSGLLLGIGWHANGCPVYGMTFLKRRCERLFPAFWSVLLIYAVIKLLKGETLPVVRFVANLTGLSWFCKLDGVGYLWFVTAILVFYVEVALLSRVKPLIDRMGAIITSCLSLLLIVALQYGLVNVGVHQAWYLAFVWVAGLAFLYAKGIVDWLFSRTGFVRITGGVFFFVFAYALYAFLDNGFCVNGAPMAYWLGIVVSLSCMVAVIAPVMPGGGIISSLSYELYLTHSMILLFVPINKLCNGMIASFVLFFCLSIVSGFVLKKSSQLFVKILK